jgi:type I restriction enzyme S subunit
VSKWEIVKLGDVCTTTQGIQIPLNEQKDYLEDGYIRYLYIGDFKGINKTLYVRDIYGNKIVNNDDLVMANTGSPGTVFKGIDGVLSNNLFKISFDKSVINRDFLYLFLSSKIFQSKLQQQMKGGIQKHLGHKTISEQEIPIPPYNVQNQIAKTLDTATELLAMRKKQLAELDNLIKSVFYDMFGDPATNEKGWEVIALGNCLERIESGWSPKCEDRAVIENEWGVCKLSAVTGGYYNEMQNKAMYKDTKMDIDLEVKKGDLLFSRKNTIELVGSCAYVFKTTKKLMIPDTIFRLLYQRQYS